MKIIDKRIENQWFMVLDKVQVAKKEAKVSNADIARFCKVSPQAVSDWFATGRISEEKKIMLCKMFNKPVSWLMPSAKNAADYEYMFKCIKALHMSLDIQGRLNKVNSHTFAEMALELYLKNEENDEVFSKTKAKEISSIAS